MTKESHEPKLPLPDWAEYLTGSRIVAIENLGVRQSAVISWIAVGKSNAEVAMILKMGIKTVELEVGQILKELKASSRCEAAVIFAHWRKQGCSDCSLIAENNY